MDITRHPKAGHAALLLLVCIWAGFYVSLRSSGRLALEPSTLATLRFAPAGLLLLPRLWLNRRDLARVGPWRALLIVAGGGLGFFLLASIALREASTDTASVLILGTLPLMVALVGALWLRRWPSRGQWPALALIVAGAAWIAIGNPALTAATLWRLLACSLAWALYTVALRVSGLAVLDAAALVAAGSLLLLLPWLVLSPPWQLAELSPATLLPPLLVQGVLVGLVATLCYGFSLERLVSLRVAAAGALAPLLAALMALALFGEAPAPAALPGMALLMGGVLTSSRAAP